MDKKRFRPNFFFLIAILTVVFLAYYAQKNNNGPVTFKVSSQNALPTDDTDDTLGGDQKREPQSSQHTDLPTDQTLGAMEDKDAVVEWVREEAKALDSVHVDTEAREKYIADKVKSFGGQQLLRLQKMALSETAMMNERILSVYMIGQSPAGRDMLKAIASQPKDNKSFEPHTEGEIKATSERAARIMAIDSIVKSPIPLEQRRSDLQEIMARTNDQFVKEYAQSKIISLQ
jgi:hypothetical protein